MTVIELGNPQELQAFLLQHSVCVVTFSAHWCGPCKASKPQLEQLASKVSVKIGYTYESDLGDFLHTFSVKAFPTYILFRDGKEVQRVQGVNFPAIEEMIKNNAGPSVTQSGGNTLGGSGDQISPEEARKLRLAKFEAPAPAATPDEPMDTSTPTAAAAASTDETMKGDNDDDDKKEGDEPMNDAEESGTVDDIDPEALKILLSLDTTALKALTEMGFSMLRAQKGLLFSEVGTVEGAINWLDSHQDDSDIDDPIPESALKKRVKKVLTPEERASKIVELKALMKAKRGDREEEEKVDHVEREKQRRCMGKEMVKTKAQMDMEQRKRDVTARKREKLDQKRERERIRAELEKDKMERRANKGKLKSALGVDGYNPSAIQYDQGESKEPAPKQPKKGHPEVAKIDDYVKNISGYRAGGDGGKCLKILKAYVGNVADNPGEDKFKKINMENKAFKTKVRPFIGAKSLLFAIGFAPIQGDPTQLVLNEDADIQIIKDTKAKLEAAFVAFG